VPAGLDLIEAAALPECCFTVWTNVFDRGRLAEGEWLLVHGGTGGIGSTAVQIATARGCSVIATCGSPEKCRVAERLGAAHTVNYRSGDFLAPVKEATNGRGVDVIVDVVGGPYTPRNLQCLAREGRLIQLGMMGGSQAEISLRTLLLRRLTITGSTLRVRTPDEKGAIALALEREIWPLIAGGAVRPVIDAVLPLSEAAEAHRRLESGKVIGKLVLVTK
jgi:NADPH2:quinone reductase